MSDELKPVRCGCGGEAKVSTWTGSNVTVINDCNAVYCENCGIQTKKYNTEDEAITAWNRAMSSAEPERKKEKTVKVEDKYHDYLPYFRFMESALKGDCGFCGETVWLGEKYCHECGTKLDWSGNE